MCKSQIFSDKSDTNATVVPETNKENVDPVVDEHSKPVDIQEVPPNLPPISNDEL